MKHVLITVIVLIMFLNCIAYGNSFEEGVQIRKTFDGAKEEKKPASFVWVDKSNGTRDAFEQVDLAVKFFKDQELLPNSTTTILTFYPTVEWHRLSSETDPKNNVSVAGNLELLYESENSVGSILSSSDLLL